MFLISWTFAADIPRLKLIQGKRDRGFDYLDVYTTGQVKARGLLLENQLLIDFAHSGIARNLKISKKHLKRSKRIKNISVKQVNAGTARIIIDLKKAIDYDIVNVFGRHKNVIEISDRSDRSPRRMASWEKTNLKKPAQALKPYQYKPAAGGQRLPLRGRVIVIDPGHGGRDPGAVSKNGLPEKKLTLAAAKKIAYWLKAAGATVYLTRKSDRTNSLRDVVRFANGIRAHAFISIHFNYADKESIAGTETYYYNRRSRGLALALHKTIINGIKRKDRGLRRAGYYAVRHTRMPAALLEPIYLSNWRESRLAGSPRFQTELAKDIVRGIKAYFRSRSG